MRPYTRQHVPDRDEVISALRATRGCIKHAAVMLEVSHDTVRRWIAELRLVELVAELRAGAAFERKEKGRPARPVEVTPKPRATLNVFQQTHRPRAAGAYAKNGVPDNRPISERSVTNLELRRSGGYRVLEGE